MDRWKYFDITHRDHAVCNPTSLAKLEEMVELLALPVGARVLDIACGKAEFTVRLVERYGCSAVGVDLSPYVIRDARELAARRVPGADVEFLEKDGADYEGEPDSFDFVICLGASWIWEGHRGALDALKRWAKPEGQILVGEPHWIKQPEDDYLDAAGMSASDFGTPYENVQIGVDLGLTPLYTMLSNSDDWDRYEALQWWAAEQWAIDNPHDPDRDEVLQRSRQARDAYLRWGRDTLGWGLYLFRK